MVRERKFLVGVDDTDASVRSVSYLAGMLEDRNDFHIVLFHVLPPIPPELLEFGGAEDPGTEQKLDEALKQEQAQWVQSEKNGRTNFGKCQIPFVPNGRAIRGDYHSIFAIHPSSGYCS